MKNSKQIGQFQTGLGRSSSVEGELGLIAALRSRQQRPRGRVRLGIGDDCAILRPATGEEIAVTTDFSFENVHFRRDWHPPESVGHRCLARGLSDLAAMGARPMAAFLSLAVPGELTVRRRGQPSWVERFFDGLLALAQRTNVTLAGGDTAESSGSAENKGLAAADIVLVGGLKRGNALLRSGARAGDVICVTGSVGGAAAELLALEHNPGLFKAIKTESGNHPHLYPQPRISAGLRLLAEKLATAAIDLSDGLSTDLRHLCDESGLAAEIDAAAIPIHSMALLAEAAGWAPSALNLALNGGEDYELLFTVPPKLRMPRKIGGIPIQPVGRMLPFAPGPQLVQLLQDGTSRTLPAGGWEHFGKR